MMLRFKANNIMSEIERIRYEDITKLISSEQTSIHWEKIYEVKKMDEERKKIASRNFFKEFRRQHFSDEATLTYKIKKLRELSKLGNKELGLKYDENTAGSHMKASFAIEKQFRKSFLLFAKERFYFDEPIIKTIEKVLRKKRIWKDFLEKCIEAFENDEPLAEIFRSFVITNGFPVSFLRFMEEYRAAMKETKQEKEKEEVEKRKRGMGEESEKRGRENGVFKTSFAGSEKSENPEHKRKKKKGEKKKGPNGNPLAFDPSSKVNYIGALETDRFSIENELPSSVLKPKIIRKNAKSLEKAKRTRADSDFARRDKKKDTMFMEPMSPLYWLEGPRTFGESLEKEEKPKENVQKDLKLMKSRTIDVDQENETNKNSIELNPSSICSFNRRRTFIDGTQRPNLSFQGKFRKSPNEEVEEGNEDNSERETRKPHISFMEPIKEGESPTTKKGESPVIRKIEKSRNSRMGFKWSKIVEESFSTVKTPGMTNEEFQLKSEKVYGYQEEGGSQAEGRKSPSLLRGRSPVGKLQRLERKFDDFNNEKKAEKAVAGFGLSEEAEAMMKVEKQKIWRLQRSVENFILSKNVKRQMEAIEDLMSMKQVIVNGFQHNLTFDKVGQFPLFQLTKTVQRMDSPKFISKLNNSDQPAS